MTTKEEAEIWKKGFEDGIKANLKENELAIRLGKAIIDALDERYEFKEEDY